MTVEADFLSALDATFSQRLFPNMAPETVTLPYAVFSVVAQVAQNVLSDTPNLYATRFQLDIFGRKHLDVHTLKASVRTAMASAFGSRAMEVLTQDGYEPLPKLHRLTMDWQIWHE